MIKHLYVHIPFCEHICSYCAFNKSIKNEKLMEKYIDSLEKELDLYELKNLKTIYIGGGTPSVLPPILLERLLQKLSSYLDTDYEFSIEINPETINEEKIKLIKKYKINRVSIGVQTFDEKILKYLNRYHNKKMVVDLIKELQKNDINNISCDLIYGIKGQTKQIIENDIKIFKELNIKHISTYCLEINEGTMLYLKNEQTLEDEEIFDQYRLITSLLSEFNHYEISNYAIKGYESKHNLCYWNNKEYLGVGLSSSSYVDGYRYSNTNSLTKYINNDYSRYEEKLITGNEFEEEYIMLHLRLNTGLNLKEYEKIFKKDFLKFYEKELKDLLQYFIINDNIIIKEEYYLLQNHILSSLLINLEI